MARLINTTPWGPTRAASAREEMQARAPQWLNQDITGGWDYSGTDAATDMVEGLTPAQMAEADAVLQAASQPDEEDYGGFDLQSMELGRMLAESLQNDFGSIREMTAMAAEAYSGQKSFGEYLNEAKARKINALNALTQQMQVEAALAKANQPEFREIKSGNEIITLADGQVVARAPRFEDNQPASYEVLTDEQAQAMGLPTGTKYQRNVVTNQVTALGGQSGDSEFERNIASLSSEEQAKLRSARARTLAYGTVTGVERRQNRWLDLSMKSQQGGLTPAEQQEFDLLGRSLSQFYANPNVGYTQISPTGESKVLVPARPEPLPQDVRQSFTQAAQALPAFVDMERAVEKGVTGYGPGGLPGYMGARLGTDENAVKFDVARNQYKLAAQALIKGIPSNFDVQTVIDTLPSFFAPAAVNRARLQFGREMFRTLVTLNVAYYHGRNVILPPEIRALAEQFGVTPETVPAMDDMAILNATTMLKERANTVAGRREIEPGQVIEVK